jgi:hypothetical protein
MHNSYSQLALILLPLGIIMILIRNININQELFILFFSIIFLFCIAFFQTALLLKNKELIIYKGLARLLLLTKQMEEILESLGASGKGLYEKGYSLRSIISEDLLKDIFFLADLRNKAVHGYPEIKNEEIVIAKAKKIKKNLKNLVLTRIKIFVWLSRMITLLYIVVGAIFFYNLFMLGGALLMVTAIYLIYDQIKNRVGYKTYFTISFTIIIGFLILYSYAKYN